MFSDRHRIVKIAGLLLALLSLAWFSDLQNRPLTLERCLEDPERYAGRELTVFPEARILEISEDRLVISQPGGPLEIRIPQGFDGVYPRGAELSDLNPGDYLELAAVFRLPGYLELTLIRGAGLRRWKIIFSLAALIVVGVFLLHDLRWKNGFLVLKPDSSDNFEL